MKFGWLNVLAIVSLVLCVGTVALWVRSYQFCDVWGRLSEHQLFDITSELGAIDIYSGQASPGPDRLGWHWTCNWLRPNGIRLPPHVRDARVFAGFDREHWENYDRVRIPFWVIASGFMVVPVIRIAHRVRDPRRFALGCCSVCGYDLRASPDRCPECGTVSGAGCRLQDQ